MQVLAISVVHMFGTIHAVLACAHMDCKDIQEIYVLTIQHLPKAVADRKVHIAITVEVIKVAVLLVFIKAAMVALEDLIQEKVVHGHGNMVSWLSVYSHMELDVIQITASRVLTITHKKLIGGILKIYVEAAHQVLSCRPLRSNADTCQEHGDQDLRTQEKALELVVLLTIAVILSTWATVLVTLPQAAAH